MSENKQNIIWPDEFHPNNAPIHVKNVLEMEVAPEVVWAWLIRAKLWPNWYPNAKRVRYDGSDLQKGIRFKWWTFGVPLTSTVVEYVPNEYIAWNAKAIGIWVYHAWLIEKTENCCRVTTEESQYGWLCRLSKLVFPENMYKYHQIWLENMQEKARTGLPTP